MILLLEPKDIEGFWPICQPILARAFRDKVNPYTVDDYLQPLLRGELQLWVVTEDKKIIGAAVSTIDKGSNMGVCSVLSLAGERLKEWSEEFDRKITEHAKDYGCSALEIVTRKGMVRVFPDFEEDGVIYVRMLK